MQFLSSVLGGSGNTLLTSILALGVVLVLVVLGLWLLKLIMKSGTVVRARGRRLQVVDQIQLDAKRQLFIIRRDSVEHVILTGGAQDLVVESGIPVEKVAQPVRRPPMQAPLRTQPRVPPRPQPEVEPEPEPVLRQPSQKPTPEPRPEMPQPAVLRPHLERLKELGRAAPASRSPSLRQTGLLRPVSIMEPAVIPMQPMAGDNSGRGKPNSATTAQSIEGNGRTAFGAQRKLGEPGSAEH